MLASQALKCGYDVLDLKIRHRLLSSCFQQLSKWRSKENIRSLTLLEEERRKALKGGMKEIQKTSFKI